MKRLYMLSVATALFFAACEKEDMTFEQPQSPSQGGNGDYIINPEDTAGIVIPEGCGLIVFPGKMQTRAVSGESNRITTLSILLYKHDGTDFKYYNKQEIGNPKSWPLKAVTSITETGKYRAVFVGNMDASLFGNEEVLTGVGEGCSYSDARIKLPSSINKFNETNLYHWCSSEEFELTEDEPVVTVPILLQRIVTRSSLTTYGIPEGITVTGKDYPSRFYASLLDENHELELYKKVFGKGSQFEKALQEMLQRDIIFPFASYLDENKLLDNNKTYVTWYNGLDRNDYLLNYVVSSANGKSEYTNNAYASIEDAKEALKTLKSKISLTEENAEVVSSFLEGLYIGEYNEELIAGIISDDFQNDDNQKSFTVVKQAVVEALKKEQNGNGAILPTWENLTNMDVQLSGSYPSAIDFDLNVVGENKTFTQSETVALSSSSEDNADKTLNIYLLGSTEGNNGYTFGLTTLSGNGISFMADGISGQTLQPNIWTNYRLVPSEIQLRKNELEKMYKVIVSYYHLTKQITNQVVKSNGIKYPLLFSNNLGNEAKWSIDGKNWNIDDESYSSRSTGTIMTPSIGKSQDKVGIFFHIPDFSPENLIGSLTWNAETK